MYVNYEAHNASTYKLNNLCIPTMHQRTKFKFQRNRQCTAELLMIDDLNFPDRFSGGITPHILRDEDRTTLNLGRT